MGKETEKIKSFVKLLCWFLVLCHPSLACSCCDDGDDDYSNEITISLNVRGGNREETTTQTLSMKEIKEKSVKCAKAVNNKPSNI